MVGTEVTRVTDIAPIGRDEAERLSLELARSMVSLLERLSPTEWDAATDCELWRVRDMTAHLLGWSEALVSPKEMAAQGLAALRQRKELGNIVDAQNQVQVDARRDVPTAELLTRLTATAPGAARRRRSTSKTLGWIPLPIGYLGGWISLRYLTDTIFPRDWFMHRIDITRATGRPFEPTPADQRILDDIVRDWFGRSGASARLELSGEIGGVYTFPGHVGTTLRADALQYVRMLFGRADHSVVEVAGDAVSAERWFSTFFPL